MWWLKKRYLRAQANQEFLEAVAVLGVASIPIARAGCEPPAGLCSSARVLHDSIFDLDEYSSAQETVSRLCEAWFAADMPGKLHLVPCCLVHLLDRSVSEVGRAVDVHRVYAMREAFSLLETTGRSFASIEQALQKAVTHPLYVMHDEGSRFLAIALSMHPHLTTVLHRAIKSQLPRFRYSTLPIPVPHFLPLALPYSCAPALRASSPSTGARASPPNPTLPASVCQLLCFLSTHPFPIFLSLPSVVRDVPRSHMNKHTLTQSHFVGGRASMVEQYGEVYLGAWRRASDTVGPVLRTLEFDCIQVPM